MASGKIEWIELPVKFKGIWYSPKQGGFFIFLRDRFSQKYPPDRNYEALQKTHLYKKRLFKQHEHASPMWIPRRVFEANFGKVEKILVNKGIWKSNEDYTTPNENTLLIFTKDSVITMVANKGSEWFIRLPRDWKKLLKKKVKKRDT
ncbi:MAG: hypothetical protein HA495_00570 [Thaumarchaeota archaeon]|nr:hypothetical protein [Nitrososphaerota archaeon]